MKQLRKTYRREGDLLISETDKKSKPNTNQFFQPDNVYVRIEKITELYPEVNNYHRYTK